MVRIVLTHLTGPRANEAEVIDVDTHAEGVLGSVARIIMIEGVNRRFVLVDLGGKEGIFVNRRRIKDAVLLRPGDVLRLGENGPELEFRIEGPLL